MAEESKACVSCGKKVAAIKGSLTFMCPSCGNETIRRCFPCRKAGRLYTCKGCGFVGP
ncbi:MAG: zinc finger domain-containing protein [archaeon]